MRFIICVRTMLAPMLAVFVALSSSAAADCLSIGDVKRAEDAALAFLRSEGPGVAAAGAHLDAQLDLLGALYPAASAGEVTTIGAYVATRRMLPLLRAAAGAEAARGYAADPGFLRPFKALIAPDGAADCGAGRRGGVDLAASATFSAGSKPASTQPLTPGPLGRLMLRLDAATPGLRYVFGFALLAAAVYLAPFRRRRDRRYACFLPVGLSGGDGDAKAHIVDISRSGAKLRLPTEMPELGQMMNLTIAGADHRASVRWRRGEMAGVAFERRLEPAEFRELLDLARLGAGMVEVTPPARAPRPRPARMPEHA